MDVDIFVHRYSTNEGKRENAYNVQICFMQQNVGVMMYFQTTQGGCFPFKLRSTIRMNLVQE